MVKLQGPCLSAIRNICRGLGLADRLRWDRRNMVVEEGAELRRSSGSATKVRWRVGEWKIIVAMRVSQASTLLYQSSIQS